MSGSWPMPKFLLISQCLVLAISAISTSAILARTRLVPDVKIVGRRFVFIDGLRGLACLLVFLNHAPLTLINLGIPQNMVHVPDKYIQKLLNVSGSVGVQIFFCVTGFLFFTKMIESSSGKLDLFKFFRNRVYRLVPLYFLAASICLVIIAGSTEMPIGFFEGSLWNSAQLYFFGFAPNPTINGFDSGRLLGVNWSLPYEWKFYLVYGVLFFAYWRWKKIRLPAVLVLGAWAVLDFLIWGRAFWPYFLSGYLAALTYSCSCKIQTADKIKVRFSFFAFFLLILPFFIGGEHYGLVRFILITLAFVAIVLGSHRFLSHRSLLYLGEISYSFYLLHGLSLYVIFSIGRKFTDLSQMSYVSLTSALALSTVVVVAFASLTYRFVEYRFLSMRRTRSASSNVHDLQAAQLL
jgi:peptidoglycan/LPS O-acetylase OafA/YrhL